MKIPEVSGHWLWGNIQDFLKEPYCYPGKIAREQGGITRFRLLHRKLIAINHPELYDQVMVRAAEFYERSFHFKTQQVLFGKGMITTDGSEWAPKRARGAPAFTRDALKKMAPLTVRTTNHYLEEWNARCEAGETITLMTEMQKLTITVICKSLFSVDMDHASTEKFCEDARESASVIRVRNASVVRLPLWVPNKANKQLKKTQTAITEFVTDKLAKRKKLKEAGEETHDILEVLLNGREMESLGPDEYADILDECKTLLLAGFETTALTLSWALYLLASHPEVAEKWHEECDRVLGKDDPAWEDLEKLAYSRQIAYETMRLYPVVFTQPRVCIKDTKLGEYEVKNGELVLLSIYGIQRSPDAWENPDAFMPERFAPGKAWPMKNYMPFGKGKHTCLGNHFATHEMMVVLAMVGKHFKLKRADEIPVGIRSTLLLMPDREIRVNLEKRP